MASPLEIQNRFSLELLTELNGVVNEDSIVYGNADVPEGEYPAVAYTVSFNKVRYNDASASRDKYTVDGDDSIEYYNTHMEAEFIVTVKGNSLEEVSLVTDLIEEAFDKYSTGGWKKTDFHEDLDDYGIRVDRIDRVDETDPKTTIRGDAIVINVLFKRIYERHGPTVTDIHYDIQIEE